VLSLFIMVKASDLAVYGVSRYAHNLGLSDYIIGFIVVAIASSMPELVSSITGSMYNQGGIILGTIFGSNLAGLALVLGVSAIFGRKIKMESKVLETTTFLVWVLVMLPFVFLIDGKLSRLDGIFLVAAFVFYISILWQKEGKLGKIKKDVELKKLWKDGLIFSGCLVAILLSARWLVFSSVIIAKSLNIRPYIIALTVIAIGSTMPDLMVSIRSIIRHHQSIGYGNAIGSMLIKCLLFLGVIAIIKPIKFPISILMNIMIFRTIIITMVLWWATKKMMNWKQGLALLGLYTAFLFVELVLR
ncbi:MAG: sodium:calcium antiporter, partial [Nanoarchaeota archaeon]|nr:sodium:calcium antiporter [Nanoarchaeota archaeon]